MTARARLWPALVAAGMLGIPCATATAQDAAPPALTLGVNPLGDFSGRVRSIQELKFAGVEKQQFDFSCGSAALATLLKLYGDSHGEATAFRGMWAGGNHAQIRKLGFSLLDMKRYLATRGHAANGYKVSLEAIEKAGIPGIALVTVKGYRHFVVITGVRGGEVLIADPALGVRVESSGEFIKSWNGVFFAIDSESPRARDGFNADRRWAGYARAPIGSRFSDPLSLQALTLTAPSFRDF